MKMNKTILAAALVTAGLSANVMAVSMADGNFTGSVDINGTITVPVVSQWEWGAGAALTLDKNSTDMTDAKHLTITIPADHALLVGQTKAGMNGKAAGSGIVPKLAFTDAQNKPVNISFTTAGAGNGTITLAVNDQSNTQIGNATINLTGVGVAVRFDPKTTKYDILGIFGNAGTAFHGGIGDVAGKTKVGDAAAIWVKRMGGKDEATLVQDVKLASNVTTTLTRGLNDFEAVNFGGLDKFFSATYALAIEAGKSIDVAFTNPITATTTWKAPLNMTVSHI